MINNNISRPIDNKINKIINLGLLSFYIFIRLIVVNILRIFGTDTYLSAEIIDILIFLIIMVLLLINFHDLENYNIDLLTLLIVFAFIFLYCVLLNKSPLTWLYILLWIMISATTIAILAIKKTKLRKPDNISILWFGGSIILGVVIGLFFSLLIINGTQSTSAPTTTLSARMVVFFFTWSMAAASIPEELFFRGFLWGFLKKSGFKENKIILIQAALFWIGHLYYYNIKITFWIIIPTSGLLLGWLTYKSKSIFPSLIVHAIYNTLNYILLI